MTFYTYFQFHISNQTTNCFQEVWLSVDSPFKSKHFSETVHYRVGNLIFHSFTLLLKISHFKEQLWAIRSCRSLQKSKLLLLLFKKEQCEWFARDASESLAKSERFTQKIDSFPPFYAQEWIAPVTLGSVAFILRATWAFCSRRSLQKERPWAIRSGHSWQKSDRSDSLFFTSESLFHSQKNERIARKTDERIPNPGSFFLFPSTQSLLPPSIKIKHI